MNIDKFKEMLFCVKQMTYSVYQNAWRFDKVEAICQEFVTKYADQPGVNSFADFVTNLAHTEFLNPLRRDGRTGVKEADRGIQICWKDAYVNASKLTASTQTPSVQTWETAWKTIYCHAAEQIGLGNVNFYPNWIGIIFLLAGLNYVENMIVEWYSRPEQDRSMEKFWYEKLLPELVKSQIPEYSSVFDYLLFYGLVDELWKESVEYKRKHQTTETA